MIRLGYVVMNADKQPIKSATESYFKRYIPFWEDRAGADKWIKAISDQEANKDNPWYQGLHVVDMLYDPKTKKVFSEAIVVPMINGA